jgi:RNA:NAD 2'-phosphotransferase (TPT1/KptA family)
LEVDTTRAIADGFTIWRAGKTVFLCEEMPAEYLFHVEEDDPAIQDMIATWEEE